MARLTACLLLTLALGARAETGKPANPHALVGEPSDVEISRVPEGTAVSASADAPPDDPLGWLLVGLIGTLLGVILPLLALRRWRYLALAGRGNEKFQPIDPCPFSPHRPVAGPLLVGREQHLRSLLALARCGGSVAAVWGERGMGKHSLLKEIARQLTDREVLVLELDLVVAVAGGSLGEMVEVMSHALARQLRATGLERELRWLRRSYQALAENGDGPGPPDRGVYSRDVITEGESKNAFAMFGSTLADLEQFLPNVRVVFLLHNADVLATAIEADVEFASYFFPFLRSLAQQRPYVCVILALEGRWFELTKRFEQLFCFATPIAVGPLDGQASAQLVEQALRGKAALSSKATEAFVRLSGGHPYLQHLMGQRAVALLNKKRTAVLSRQIVERVAAELIDDPDARLETSWVSLSPEERLLVAAISEHGGSNHALSTSDLALHLSGSHARLLPEEIRRAVVSLQRHGLVAKHRDIVSLRCGILGRWVAQHYSMAAVLEGSYDYVGQYQLLERLGSGGMGVVYRARDVVSGRGVAVKLLRPELLESRRSRRRLQREARLGQRLDHPHIIRILDYGEQAGRLYLTMEYLEGITLGQWIRQHKAPTARMVVEAGLRLASALAAIHDAGIVHRDIKSDNVMVVGAPRLGGLAREQNELDAGALKLMDFGLAVGGDVARVTRVGAIFGTASYMSPEQALGRMADERSDLYSLGAVLYELCTGQAPFLGTEIPAVVHAVVHERVRPLEECCPGLPKQLVELVESLLNKDPDARPSSAVVVEQRFSHILTTLTQDCAPIARPPRPGEKDRSAKITLSGLDGQASQEHTSPGLVSQTIDSFQVDGGLLALLTPSDSTVSQLSQLSSQPEMFRVLALYEISAAVARRQAPQRILVTALRLAVQTVHADQGIAVLYSPHGEVQGAFVHGPGGEEMKNREAVTAMMRNAAARRIGLRFEPEDEDAKGSDLGAAACVPLWSGERVLGAMCLERVALRDHFFAESDLEFLASLGYLLGIGLENDALHKQIMAQNQELESARMRAERRRAELDLLYRFERNASAASDVNELVDSVIREACVQLRSKAGSMLLAYESEGGTLFARPARTEAAIRLEQRQVDTMQGVIGWVATSGQPAVVNTPHEEERHEPEMAPEHYRDCRALLSVPLVWQDRVIGALEVINPHHSDRGHQGYDTVDLKVLTVVAAQVARAVSLLQEREARIDTKRLALVGQMLAGVAHDFRNPMAVIAGYVQLIAGRLAPERVAEYCGTILDHVDEMNDLIADLIMFARDEMDLRPQPVALADLGRQLRERLSAQCDERGLSLRLTADPVVMDLDAGRVKRILLSLARHCIGSANDLPQLEVDLRQRNGTLEIRLAGPRSGLMDALHAHLCDPFPAQHDVPVSGLDLTIVKRFVEDHRGTVALDQIEGEGPCLVVTLPAL